MYKKFEKYEPMFNLTKLTFVIFLLINFISANDLSSDQKEELNAPSTPGTLTYPQIYVFVAGAVTATVVIYLYFTIIVDDEEDLENARENFNKIYENNHMFTTDGKPIIPNDPNSLVDTKENISPEVSK